MPSVYIKYQGLCDFANENQNSLDISLGLIKSFYCNFCCCLCWGLLQLPQHKKCGTVGVGQYGGQQCLRPTYAQAREAVALNGGYSGLKEISLFTAYLNLLLLVFRFKDGISYHYLTGFVEGKKW